MTFPMFLIVFAFCYAGAAFGLGLFLAWKRKDPKEKVMLSDDIDFAGYGWQPCPKADPKEVKHTKENYMLRLAGSASPHRYWRFFKLDGNRYREIKHEDGASFEFHEMLTNDHLDAFDELTGAGKKYVALRPSYWDVRMEK